MDTNIIANANTGQTTNADRYEPIYGSGVTWNATESAALQVMTTTGTLKNFYISIANSDASFSRTFALRKNGVDTAITVTIGIGATSGNDTTHTASYVPGDYFTIHSTAGGTTTNTGTTAWTLTATETGATSFVTTQSISKSGTSGTNYIPIQAAGFDASAANVEVVMPTAGTFKNLYVLANTTEAGSKAIQITLFKNGSSTTLTASVTGGLATATDSTHSIAVAAGDRFYFELQALNTPTTANVAIAMEWDPTIAGESVHTFNNATVIPSNTTVRIVSIATGSGWTTNANEPTRRDMVSAATWKKFYVFFSADPTPGSYQLQVTKNGTAGNPSVTIGAGSTIGNDTTNTISTVVTDGLTVTATPSSTPTAPIAEWGIVSFVAPPTLSVTVSDSVTLTEAKTVTISGGVSTLSVNVSDSTSLTENIVVTIPENVPVSDSTSLSENVVLGGIPNPSVSDNTTITENVKLDIPLTVTVSDSTTVSESAVAAVTGGVNSVTVSDSITVTEAVTLDGIPNPSVSDTVTLSESPQLDIPINIVVSESISVSESVAVSIMTGSNVAVPGMPLYFEIGGGLSLPLKNSNSQVAYSNGAPTGTPTSYLMVYDYTNDVLYVYNKNSAAWKSVAFS